MVRFHLCPGPNIIDLHFLPPHPKQQLTGGVELSWYGWELGNHAKRKDLWQETKKNWQNNNLVIQFVTFLGWSSELQIEDKKGHELNHLERGNIGASPLVRYRIYLGSTYPPRFYRMLPHRFTMRIEIKDFYATRNLNLNVHLTLASWTFVFWGGGRRKSILNSEETFFFLKRHQKKTWNVGMGQVL